VSLRTPFIAVLLVACVVLGSFLAVTMAWDEDALFIEIPPDIDLRQVQVHSGLIGSFGGFFQEIGASDESLNGINVPLNNRDHIRANSVKAIIYSPGCRFQKFALDPLPASPHVRFECEPLGSVPLRGRIVDYPRPQEIEIRVYYSAVWQMSFFGYYDGSPPHYLIATTHPDASGSFQLAAPNFEGEARWDVRGYVRGELRLFQTVRIQPSYPSEIKFSVRP